MPDWIGFSTRVFGFFGRRVLRRWLFEAEFLGATRAVYISKSGQNSPRVLIRVGVRVHNRNSAPTTVYVRNIAVKLRSGIDRKLEPPDVMESGPIGSMDDLVSGRHHELGGYFARELVFFTRRWNPEKLTEYQEGASPQVILELGETFGNHCRLSGPLDFAGEYLEQ